MLTLTTDSSVDRNFYQSHPSRASSQSWAKPNQAQNKAPSRAKMNRVEPRIKSHRSKPSRAEPSLEPAWAEPSFEPSRAERRANQCSHVLVNYVKPLFPVLKSHYHHHHVLYRSVASPRGQAGQLAPPPNLRPDTPWDRCRSEEILVSEKVGVGLQNLLRRFICTDVTADVLWSYDYEKRGSCGNSWRSYSGRPSVKLRGPLGSFSPGIGPPNH